MRLAHGQCKTWLVAPTFAPIDSLVGTTLRGFQIMVAAARSHVPASRQPVELCREPTTTNGTKFCCWINGPLTLVLGSSTYHHDLSPLPHYPCQLSIDMNLPEPGISSSQINYLTCPLRPSIMSFSWLRTLSASVASVGQHQHAIRRPVD